MLFIYFTKNQLSVDCCIEIINLLGADNDISIDGDYKNIFQKTYFLIYPFLIHLKRLKQIMTFIFYWWRWNNFKVNHIYKRFRYSILGINTGRLGFLTGLQKESLKHGLELLKNNKYQIVKRSTITISSGKNNIDFGESPFALNEITINRKDTTSLLKYLVKLIICITQIIGLMA